MEERRAIPRTRVFKAGSIEFDGAVVDCTIRNLSLLGAGIEVATPLGIPHEVTLLIISRHERQHCHIIWRGDRRIGVAFDNAGSARGIS
ncbi:PilZ domain-containing protein [Bradyrhizobium sp.]|uniref:PilZ domain-containing protein n=1 Tax=Bradyrhizobium sp. TaxID=376 RepID=UPI003C70EAAA